MMKVLILIVKCVVIGLCSCQNQDLTFLEEGPPTITLIYDQNDFNIEQKLLNDKLYNIASKMGFAVDRKNSQDIGIAGTVDLSENYPNVINLLVPLQEDVNQRVAEIIVFNKSNLMCLIGCIFMTSVNIVNKVNFVIYNNTTTCPTTDSESLTLLDEHFYLLDGIPPVLVENDIARIVSDTIPVKYTRLNEIIAMPNIDPELPKILVCLPNSNADNDELQMKIKESYDSEFSDSITIDFKNDCNDDTLLDNSTLAVLANIPLNSPPEVPILFYQMSSYFENESHYPISINLSPKNMSLKYTLVEFLKRMNWHRVAILSCDSEYSQDFSKDLQILLRNNDFAFTTEQCEGRNCDFSKALKTLLEAQAKIIILNIDSKYAENILSAINSYQQHQVTWVVRDWPFKEFALDHRFIGHMVFSLNEYSIYAQHNYEVPYFSTLERGLEIIKFAYQKSLGDIDKFRRGFLAAAKRKDSESVPITRVTLLKHLRTPVKVADIIFRGADAECISFKMDSAEIPSDVAEACLLRSYDFHNPCQNETLQLLMVVFVMFALMNLLIVCFFNYYRSQPRYSQLRN